MSGIQKSQENQNCARNVKAHIGIERGKSMELIKIEEREGKKTVNARDIHEFLEVKKDFSEWIKVQITRARLLETRDFVVFTQKGENGGRPKTEYHLTLEGGKHIAMLSGTEKGFNVRDYFIECERQVKELTPAEMLLKQSQLMVEQERKMLALNNRVDLIEAKQTTRQENYFTVAGYCSLKRIQVSQLQAADLGRKCAKLSREKNYKIETVPDARFGRVNIYHTDILQQIVC